MEYSSPLAAMRPQPCPAWGPRPDLPLPRGLYSGCHTYGSKSFDFQSMRMQDKPVKRDYFSLKPVRGSSPTSSLTADLDANFHIDKSPQVQTPRRSLFTANLFKPQDDLLTPPIELERASTPLVPSSSPGMDGMDISPLPHKQPCFIAQVTLPSPSPQETPDEEGLVSPDLLSPLDLAPPLSGQPQPSACLPVPERRRPATRPVLSRHKANSTTQVPTRPASAENQLPPFRFGAVVTTGLSCSSTPCLAEGFTESPVTVEGQQPPSLPSSMLPPRRPSLSAASRSAGSPCGQFVRKPAAQRPPFTRPPRKQMRRSLSMFQHPEDVMKEEQDAYELPTNLASIMDIDQPEYVPMLPHFTPHDEVDGLPRISQETMVDVLDAKYSGRYDNIIIVDCRFEYEYLGGHIEGAVNYNDKQLLADSLFQQEPTASTLLILHCEYSELRAPKAARFVRNHDRNVNAASYPRLSYPEMYILDGGYSRFFKEHRSKCFPQNYIGMNDERHEQACERGMAKVKQQRQKLFRNATFAFGQSDHDEMQSSPTAQGRHALGARSHSTFDVGPDIAHGIGQSFQRRMASY